VTLMTIMTNWATLLAVTRNQKRPSRELAHRECAFRLLREREVTALGYVARYDCLHCGDSHLMPRCNRVTGFL